ncbi:hypothetical protein MKW94_026717 [Papaver nudicaule]|uniref:Uncharacterized protein n=1 Tax=Papaver nudicaule TaxID=74823 RepID=A0AA41SJA7_PAPNU|nr:hypothetical protein [Papaver nudicaule]
MAKAAHLSLSPYLIGFLLVLVVANTAYVRGECDEGNRVRVSVEGCDDCDNMCRSKSDFQVSHTSCLTTRAAFFTDYYCICCR